MTRARKALSPHCTRVKEPAGAEKASSSALVRVTTEDCYRLTPHTHTHTSSSCSLPLFLVESRHEVYYDGMIVQLL